MFFQLSLSLSLSSPFHLLSFFLSLPRFNTSPPLLVHFPSSRCLSFFLFLLGRCRHLPTSLLFSLSTPHEEHHPLLPSLHPAYPAERQSTKRSQFEHASLRITKGLVRPPLPPSQTIPLLVPSSAVRPHSFSLSLLFSPFPSFPLSCLSAICFSLFLPAPRILPSSDSSRVRIRSERGLSEHRAALDLPSKWIQHAPVRPTRRAASRTTSVAVPFAYFLRVANAGAGWHSGRPGNRAPVDTGVL